MIDGALDGFLSLRAACIQRAPPEPGLALCHALSDTLDVALAGALPPQSSIALIALGGYGRRELSLFSDIDLMLLYEGALPAAAIDAVLYPLWDAGFKVGHAVRTVREAAAAAGERIDTLTSLLDGRLLAGPGRLAERIDAELAKLLKRRPGWLNDELAQAEAERQRAEPYQLLETNLKNGRGGLRSLHGRHWSERAAALAGGTRAGDGADQDTAAAQELLLRSRNALHAVAGQAQDAWVFDLQPAACAWLGVELDSWSVQLYSALRLVSRSVEAAWNAHEARRSDLQFGGRLRGLIPTAQRRRPRAAEASEADQLATRIRPGQSVFAYAGELASRGERGLPVAAAGSIRAAAGPSWSAADRNGLLALLRAGERGRELFDALDGLDWLERALPEWRHVRGAPQHAPFHRHPVDVHLWRTVIESLQLAEGEEDEPWCREVAADLGQLDELLLAGLLHDIGKGWPGDHAATGADAAMAFCRRAHFAPEFMLTVADAVRHHLLLPIVATRRDIADERVVEDVADHVGRAHTLRVLYLLSVADSRATGPAVWSPWKGSLVRSLFAGALRILESRSGASPLSRTAPDLRAHALDAAVGQRSESEVNAHIDAMASGYLQSFSAEEVLRHLGVMNPSPAGDECRLNTREDGAVADLLFVARDRPGLIALVSGVLALHNLSVLDGRYFTREDGTALQALHLFDALGNQLLPERWQRVTADLQKALRGELPLERRLQEKVRAYRRKNHAAGAPTEVRLVLDASDAYTVVEIHAADRIGLLHSIAEALFQLRLDIHLAKIDTQGNRVVDVFYLRDWNGRPLRDAERLQALKPALLDAVAALPGDRSGAV